MRALAMVIFALFGSGVAVARPRRSVSARGGTSLVLPPYCSSDPKSTKNLVLITNEGICLNSTEAGGIICGAQMTRVPLRCESGIGGGFSYGVFANGQGNTQVDPKLINKPKGCVANGMPPDPNVQPVLEFILDKEKGPMFTPHNTGAMVLMCGY